MSDAPVLCEELPAGERGELCIKSPANILGYWNKPEATAETFREGWYHTGEVEWIAPLPSS